VSREEKGRGKGRWRRINKGKILTKYKMAYFLKIVVHPEPS